MSKQNDDNTFELSRRKALAGLSSIGIASAGAGLGTSAFFSDTEQFEDNQLVAGELDLKVDWQQRYYSDRDGEVEDDPTTWTPVNAYPDFDGDDLQDTLLTRQQITDEIDQSGSITVAGVTLDQSSSDEEIEAAYRNQFADLPDDRSEAVIDLDDVKPGDKGEITFSFHLFDNPGFIWTNGELLADAENSVVEPEADDPDEDNAPGNAPYPAGAGELADEIQAKLFYDDNCNNQFDTGEPCVQFVVDNTDSMTGQADSDDPNVSKSERVVDALETYIQGLDGDSDGGIDSGEIGFSLFSEDAISWVPPTGSSTETFVEFATEGGDPAPPTNADPQTNDVSDLLGNTSADEESVTDGDNLSLNNATGIQNIYDQDLTTGTADVDRAIDEGAAALERCQEDTQRYLVLVTNGVNLSTSDLITAAQANLRTNGGSVDKYIFVGLFPDDTSSTILSSIESVPGDHEYIRVDSITETDAAFNGPLGNVTGPNPDSTVASEIDVGGGSSQDTVIAEGTLREVLNAITGPFGFPLDGDRSTDERDCYQPSETNCLALLWELDVDHANEIQTDTAEFDIGFYTEQCRHNDGGGGNGNDIPPTDTPVGRNAISYIAFCSDSDGPITAIIDGILATDDDGDPTSVNWSTDTEVDYVVVYWGSRAGPQMTIYDYSDDDTATSGTATTGDSGAAIPAYDAMPGEASTPCAVADALLDDDDSVSITSSTKLEYVDGEFVEE